MDFFRLEDVGVALDATAATGLNSVFHVTGFTSGLSSGTAKVSEFPFLERRQVAPKQRDANKKGGRSRQLPLEYLQPLPFKFSLFPRSRVFLPFPEGSAVNSCFHSLIFSWPGSCRFEWKL
jgi:hypothetical protein